MSLLLLFKRKGGLFQWGCVGWEVVAVARGTGWCREGGSAMLGSWRVWGQSGEGQLCQGISTIFNLLPLSWQLATRPCRLILTLTWELHKYLWNEWVSYFLQNQCVKGVSKHAKMRPEVMGTKCRLAQNVTKIRVGEQELSRKDDFYPRVLLSSFSPPHVHLKASQGVFSWPHFPNAALIGPCIAANSYGQPISHQKNFHMP